MCRYLTRRLKSKETIGHTLNFKDSSKLRMVNSNFTISRIEKWYKVKIHLTHSKNIPLNVPLNIENFSNNLQLITWFFTENLVAFKINVVQKVS